MAKIVGLTLPGAILWSIPVGIQLHQKFGKPWVAEMGKRFLYTDSAIAIWTALAVVSVLCNVAAIRTCNRVKSGPRTVTAIRIVNVLLAIVSGTFFGYIMLALVAKAILAHSIRLLPP